MVAGSDGDFLSARADSGREFRAPAGFLRAPAKPAAAVPWTRPPGPLLSYCDYSLLSFDIHVQILPLPDSSSKYCR